MNNLVLPGATVSVTPNLNRFLERLNRRQIEVLAQAAVDRLDELDGDSDFETGGDLEDDFVLIPHALACGSNGPGCKIGDEGGGSTDEDLEQEEPCRGFWGVNQAEPISDSNPVFG